MVLLSYFLSQIVYNHNLKVNSYFSQGTKTYSADKDVPQYYNGHTPTTNHCSSENILPFGNMRETISLQAMPTHCDGHSEQEKMMMVPDVRAGSSSALEVSVRSSNSGQYLQVRSSNVKLSLANKKRVIKMLFVVVLEYFVCWTPTYIINTLALYQPKLVYHELGYMALSVFQLLGFISSCCNPITYCFMNSRFKHAFLSAFGCQRRSWQPSGLSNVSSKTSFPMKLESEI